MSVGHLARLLEASGIPTVIIAVKAFQARLNGMTVPRLLLTPHLMGWPIGAPGDKERQRETIRSAFQLLEQARHPGSVKELSGRYRPLRAKG